MRNRLARGITSDDMMLGNGKLKEYDIAWLRSPLASDDIEVHSKKYNMSEQYLRSAIQGIGAFKDKYLQYEPRILPRNLGTLTKDQREYVVDSDEPKAILAAKFGVKVNTIYQIRYRAKKGSTKA
jgi:hypothetical protein